MACIATHGDGCSATRSRTMRPHALVPQLSTDSVVPRGHLKEWALRRTRYGSIVPSPWPSVTELSAAWLAEVVVAVSSVGSAISLASLPATGGAGADGLAVLVALESQPVKTVMQRA